jgi:tetratricopeptide (TPR) repeat protein
MGSRKSLGIALAAALALASFTPAAEAQRVKSDNGPTLLLRQLYLNGQARIARGDPAGAAAVFQVTSEVAPELPQMQYSLALSQVLADFSKRERALPAIDKALASEPGHPLYNIVKVMADPALSSLDKDGSLALSPAGTERFRTARAQLKDAKDAINGRYLAPILANVQESGNGMRLAGFDAMIGPGGKVMLPQTRDAQAFGRLFTVSVTDSELQPFEPRMVARLQNGPESLKEDSLSKARVRSRLESLKDAAKEG